MSGRLTSCYQTRSCDAKTLPLPCSEGLLVHMYCIYVDTYAPLGLEWPGHALHMYRMSRVDIETRPDSVSILQRAFRHLSLPEQSTPYDVLRIYILPYLNVVEASLGLAPSPRSPLWIPGNTCVPAATPLSGMVGCVGPSGTRHVVSSWFVSCLARAARPDIPHISRLLMRRVRYPASPSHPSSLLLSIHHTCPISAGF